MKSIGTAILLFLLACQNPGGGNSSQPPDTATAAARATPTPPDTTTLAGRWYLQPVLPSDTATGKIPWLDINLDLSSFTGNTGCNSMHGKLYFAKTDSSLSFANKITISKKTCTGFNEAAFLKSLRNTARYKLHHDTLTLIGDDHSELSRWLRSPPTAMKALKA
ncbi:MAG TPA: META domain-containing protein [Puia sp.]|jgi:heat shock protein HslJ|nr:META domain-containing protein [Puia sp.]